MFTLLLLSTQAAVAPPTEIVVSAARSAEDKAKTAASVAVIDAERIERLGQPLLESLVRLTPSASVATSGPAGSLTE
ncbi:MAG: hypothetical protein M3428_02575, partial [Pseudomonadota bacterium]|nr:hypothetical protein [Pseudomonadota bacterium]